MCVFLRYLLLHKSKMQYILDKCGWIPVENRYKRMAFQYFTKMEPTIGMEKIKNLPNQEAIYGRMESVVILPKIYTIGKIKD